ncbi:MAG: FAD-dependent oxidoreductase, partial [Caulobacteraceae bacterium]
MASFSAMAKLGAHALVLGAGIGGLAAAGALAPHFERVTVVERDQLPDEPTTRLGAPQGRHVHALLAGGQQALEGLYPGFTKAIVAAGAVALRANADVRLEASGYDPFPQRDFGWLVYSLSRPLIEFTVRRLAEGAGVVFLARRRVRRLEASGDGSAIVAVHLEDEEKRPERIGADLIVDATGRAHPTLDLLKSLGRPAPPETVIGVDLSYASAVFEVPQGPLRDWKWVITFPNAGEKVRAGVLAPIEQGRWILTLGGFHDDAPPLDEAGYMAFVRSLRTPTIFEAIGSARRLGEIAGYGFRESIWRHFDRAPPLPRGLIPFSDSICRFNPIYGQGMSVAALEGALLARLLGERAALGAGIADLSDVFLLEARDVIQGPW